MFDTIFIITSIFPSFTLIKKYKDKHIVILTKQKPEQIHKMHIEWFSIKEIFDKLAIYQPDKIIVEKSLSSIANFDEYITEYI